MFKPISLLFFALLPLALFAQKSSDTIPLKDMIVPTSPGFNLLDIAPTTVERPATVKQLALNVANTLQQSSGLPQNFAMEFAPFWLFKHPNMSIFKYNGLQINKKAGGEQEAKSSQNILYGARNFSISVATAEKDSGQGVGVKTNFLAYSIKANIITVRKQRVLDSLNKSILGLNKQLVDDTKKAANKCGIYARTDHKKYMDCIEQETFISDSTVLDSLTAYYDTLLTIRPIFTADVALASSTAFGNNSITESHVYRSGGWVTICYSQPLSLKKNKTLSDLYKQTNYINLYGIGRVLSEDSTTDFKTFTRYTYLDFGGRVELEFDRMAISFESVHRKVTENTALNSSRNVGILQYKVNGNFYLTGTFGKNFGGQSNLIAFLGLNFGFGNTALYNKLQSQ
jgi:hypothetical protein